MKLRGSLEKLKSFFLIMPILQIHQPIESYKKMQRVNKSSQHSTYIPGLHPEMPDWKKVRRYTELVTKQFPRLDGKPLDTKSPAYTAEAIEYVNDELAQEKIRREKENERQKLAYDERCRRREEKKVKEEAEKQRKEASHVEEMKKKYGYGWENDVDGTDEDCPTAYNLRLEWEREDEIQYYKSQEESARWEKECEERMDKEEHEDVSFDFRMEIETKGMNHLEKNVYIREKRQIRLYEKLDRIDEDEAEFEAEGDQWYFAIERYAKERDTKKARIAAYEVSHKK